VRVRNALGRAELPLLGLWITLAIGLSIVVTSVRDWFVMTDELLYERFSISIAQTGSPLPRLHGDLIPSLAQVYPLLIAPVFRHGLVPGDLRQAHLLNAWIMSSACVPAFLLTRRLVGRRLPAYAAAVVTVCMPWIIYSSFLLTEVAAYPVFLWAIFAMQCSLAAPSNRNDVAALAALALAFFTRTEFVFLIPVFGLVLLLVERRAVFIRHRMLTGAYGLLAIAAAALAATGHLSSVFGVYGDTIRADLLPPGTGRWLLEHVAALALGLGILPFVIGAAWLLANMVRTTQSRELHAFACLASLTVLGLVFEVTIYDLHLGVHAAYDRYLFYAAPLLLIGALCAILDKQRPRWSLLLPCAAVAAGFGLDAPPGYTWSQFPMLDPNTPVAALYRPITNAVHGVSAARASLAAGTLLLALLFALGARYASRIALTIAVSAFIVVVIPAETAYAFTRLFDTNGWSLRPVTLSENDFSWIDRTIGAAPRVTMVPYPISTNYFSSQQRWRDMEFWNKSIARDAQLPGGAFTYTGNTFPKLMLQFDPANGASATSPTRYGAESDKETRFRLSGRAIGLNQDVLLIDAGKKWHLDWLSFGLYDDGWTRPGVTARVRIYPTPGQQRPLVRTLTIATRAPDNVAQRPVSVTSNIASWQAVATDTDTVIKAVNVCVPAHGWTEVRISTPDASWSTGSIDTLASSFTSRRVGVFLGEIALADEIGGPCRP
jgi:hypothetical protein